MSEYRDIEQMKKYGEMLRKRKPLAIAVSGITVDEFQAAMADIRETELFSKPLILRNGESINWTWEHIFPE
jgi:t-SNARE complex subunit (syntaxin)